ncbi:MAG TPA: hypothetical protein VL307_01365, partial [Chitinophagaceae bacterium]|nr:hypothetical protein [Chitinophagaceae bacterium]
MKYLVASFLLFFCTLQTFGQREYFIYLQTDNSQPFYARFNNAVYSSTNSGYLILAKLPDSAVSVTIGFPKNVYPEQQFNIPATHKDGGYLIKNFADKGWGLFNLQTLSVIMSTAADEKKKPEITGSRKNDAFSLLLANAVNDTAVLYAVNKPKPAPVALVTEKKKDTLRADAPAAKDTAIIAAKLPPAPDSSQLATTRKKDSVVKPLPPVPDSNKAIAKEKVPAPDTAQTMASKPPPVKRTATAAAKDTVSVAVVTKTRRPLFSLPGRKEQPPRKDTIIMMNNKGNVSNPAPPKNTPPRDSLVASNTSNKAKPSADSAITLRKQSPKADSARSAVVNKAPVTSVVPDNGKEQVKKQDTALAVINSPVRPTITKAADFFTDSGYE